jgi:hypothetical protein
MGNKGGPFPTREKANPELPITKGPTQPVDGQDRMLHGETMTEIIVTPISYFEMSIDYEEPNIQLWLDRDAVVQAIFKALKPWNIQVDNVEIITTGKPSEQGLKFKIPEKRVSFFFGPAQCKFTKDSADWESAQETIQIMDAAFSALAKNSGIVVASQKTIIALHIQPKKLPFMDILGPFIPKPILALESGPATSMASFVKWDKRRIIIDGSGQIANGIFLRFEREFDGKASYEEIAAQLKSDEDALFEVLGVREERQ